MKKIKLYTLVVFLLASWGCNDNSLPELPTYDERVTEAVSALKSKLTAPTNGWVARYKPTTESGEYILIFDFDENGNVNIKSDVSARNGEFYDQNVSYRVDNNLGIELIFETYGVLHYLFEIDQSTFGADFEYIYDGERGDTLVFYGKNSISTSRLFNLTPASANEENRLSREIDDNLSKLRSDFNTQQLVLEDAGITVFWELDDAKRTLNVSLAGVGLNYEEVFSNNELRVIDQTSGYKLENDQLILENPIRFLLGGRFHTISILSFADFTNDAPNLCALNSDNDAPSYTGLMGSSGKFILTRGLFDLEGTGFVPQPGPYTVNVFFVFDENGASLAEDGLIQEYFPNASAFVFNYNADTSALREPFNESSPYSVGLLLDNGEDEDPDLFMRSFEQTTTVGNRVSVSLTNEYYHSAGASATDLINLAEITDKLFEGQDMYAFDFPLERADFQVFILSNACNDYQLYLVN